MHAPRSLTTGMFNRTLGPALLFLFTFAACAMLVVPAAHALTAAEVFTQSQEINPGQDQQSKLTLLIKDGDGNTRKVVLKRFWKMYPDGDLTSKVLLFHEYPPESRGTAFMVWTYTEASKLGSEQWIYIPILRKVNKLPGQMEENIQGSDLRASDMDPRDPSLDSHTLLREEAIGTENYYVVESAPKVDDKAYPYSKVIRWISSSNFLIDKIDYYDREGKLLKKQTISWKMIKDAWVWQKVVIANMQTGSQTTLNLTDIQVNQGLKESLFTERMMQQGAAALR
ncbi:MAG: outer membrane lipoprotein-sorting protein [Nitrospirae bacterium]|nr:outer membrane lipoprotein-sorting protein [Nitrospirota bacterium]